MAMGERLRELRQIKGLKLEDFPSVAGGPHLSKVERGLALPSAEALDSIAAELEIDPNELAELHRERKQLALTGRIKTIGRSERVEIDESTAEALAALTQLDREARTELLRVTEALESLGNDKRDRLVDGLRGLLESFEPNAEDSNETREQTGRAAR